MDIWLTRLPVISCFSFHNWVLEVAAAVWVLVVDELATEEEFEVAPHAVLILGNVPSMDTHRRQALQKEIKFIRKK